jgi:phosphatidylglycerophosphate synthase
VFDAALRRRVDPLLDGIATLAVRAGVRADAITLGGAAIGLAACVAIALRADMAALALLALNRVADGLDGAVARQTGPTDRGGFLDIVCDFLFYGGFVFAFAVGRPETALAAAFLLVSFIGTATSFLAFAVFAAKRGLTTDVRGAKSLYYLGGLTEGAETIALFVVFCIVPAAFPWLAWGFGALCWITVGVRVAAGWSAFRQ